jgi:hypothetical protein
MAEEPVAGRSGLAGASGNARGGMNGMPMGAGHGKGDEDTERKAPQYLEGGDPDELFDTDALTAPPVIGAEDDE